MRRAPLLISLTLSALAALFTLVGSALPLRPADAQPPLVRRVSLTGAPNALTDFHRALRAGRARVYVYGASHTAPDVYTGELRRRLQARFGDGGPGWVIPASPFPFYDHAQVTLGGTGWVGRKVRYREQRRDAYGLAGIALDASGQARARVRLREGHSDRVAVHFLRQPGGGRLMLGVGGQMHAIDTAGPRRIADSFEVALDEAVDDVSLRAEGRVRVFGLTLEQQGGGVVVDAFGVPGARFRDQEPWDEPTLRAQLRGRPPDLVAFAYGTNESDQRRVPIETYREHLRAGLARWRRLAPRASCLLIGPGEWPRQRSDGTLAPRRRTNQIIAVQREEAQLSGCAFFDTFRMMGGEGSMTRWVAADLAIEDHVHFTDEGYRRMGAELHRALMEGFTPR